MLPKGWTIHTISALVGIGLSLFGGIKFAINEVSEQADLVERVARLEAQEPVITGMREDLHLLKIEVARTDSGMTATAAKVDALNTALVDLRVRMERLSTMLEKR